MAKLISIDAPHHILEYSSTELRAIGLSESQIRFLRHDSERQAIKSLEWQTDDCNHILTLNDPRYPSLLATIADPPPILYLKGDHSLLSQSQLAVIGSRNASLDGLNHAQEFAHQLAKLGLTITSGLALGIDGRAHQGALAAGGNTIAVLGSGLDCIYPARHRKLARQIIEQGLLVSELAPNVPPKGDHFPRRNRIISGLSVGVLVVEAAQKSGSLITARLAAEQGRDVFVIPASITHPNASGGNELIRNGAILVERTQQIIDEINGLLNWSLITDEPVAEKPIIEAPTQGELFTTYSQPTNERLPFSQLLANVGDSPVAVDILAEKTNISIQEVMTQLLELELHGLVAATLGGYIRVRGSKL